jgi:hypothetical protein
LIFDFGLTPLYLIYFFLMTGSVNGMDTQREYQYLMRVDPKGPTGPAPKASAAAQRLL